MSREIKFRAWDESRKVMIYRSGIITTNGEFFKLCEFRGITLFEEFTGLKDNTRTEEFPEGKEIYEGDVVITTDAFRKNKYIIKYIDKANTSKANPFINNLMLEDVKTGDIHLFSIYNDFKIIKSIHN